MNHETNIQSAVKAVKKFTELAKRNLQNIAETRRVLPQKREELEALRKIADIRIDAHLKKLADLQQWVQICEGLLERIPESLEPDNKKLRDAIDALNGSILDAGRSEREALIKEATKVFIPFFGSEGHLGGGGTCNPSRVAAESMPLLASVVTDGTTCLGCVVNYGGTPEAKAENYIGEASKSLAVAESWLRAGGKFAQYLK